MCEYICMCVPLAWEPLKCHIGDFFARKWSDQPTTIVKPTSAAVNNAQVN